MRPLVLLKHKRTWVQGKNGTIERNESHGARAGERGEIGVCPDLVGRPVQIRRRSRTSSPQQRTLEKANQYSTQICLVWWERDEPASPDDAHRPLEKVHNLASSLSFLETPAGAAGLHVALRRQAVSDRAPGGPERTRVEPTCKSEAAGRIAGRTPWRTVPARQKCAGGGQGEGVLPPVGPSSGKRTRRDDQLRFDARPRRPCTTTPSPLVSICLSNERTQRSVTPNFSAASFCVTPPSLARFNQSSQSRSSWLIAIRSIPPAWRLSRGTFYFAHIGNSHYAATRPILAFDTVRHA